MTIGIFPRSAAKLERVADRGLAIVRDWGCGSFGTVLCAWPPLCWKRACRRRRRRQPVLTNDVYSEATTDDKTLLGEKLFGESEIDEAIQLAKAMHEYATDNSIENLSQFVVEDLLQAEGDEDDQAIAGIHLMTLLNYSRTLDPEQAERVRNECS